MNPKEPKIFVVGFNRCGTTSLHLFFKKNGIESAHWNGGKLALTYKQNLSQGELPFAGYEQCTAFTDMIYLSENELIEPYKNIEALDEAYPDSLFMLNTRDCDKWIRSRHNHSNWTVRYRAYFGLNSDAAAFSHWRQDWHEHHLKVLQYFSKHPGRLLVYNIEQHKPKRLCRFLNPYFGKLKAKYLRKVN